jgi:hypothetical protein
MADRVALFRARAKAKPRTTAEPAPDAKTRPNQKTQKSQKNQKSRSKLKEEPKPTKKTAAAPRAKPNPKPKSKAASATKPAKAAKTGATTGLAARLKPAAWSKPGGAKAAKPGGKTAPRRTRPRRPPPPLLQRRTLGPTLARAAVLALAMVAMVGFAVALAKVTLVPSPASVDLIHTNLRPGASIRAYLDQPALRDTVKQIGGNIVLGVPFGVLLPVLFPRTRGLLRVVVVTALVMVVVETVQGAIVEGRAFDIDDVILNTTGALLGYLLLGRRLGHALHPRRVHWWHRLGFGDPALQEEAARARRPARTKRS